MCSCCQTSPLLGWQPPAPAHLHLLRQASCAAGVVDAHPPDLAVCLWLLPLCCLLQLQLQVEGHVACRACSCLGAGRARPAHCRRERHHSGALCCSGGCARRAPCCWRLVDLRRWGGRWRARQMLCRRSTHGRQALLGQAEQLQHQFRADLRHCWTGCSGLSTCCQLHGRAGNADQVAASSPAACVRCSGRPATQRPGGLRQRVSGHEARRRRRLLPPWRQPADERPFQVQLQMARAGGPAAAVVLQGLLPAVVRRLCLQQQNVHIQTLPSA
jgi:hypothetical protein